MTTNYLTNQRDIYKLLDKITSKEFKSELDMLKSLVRDIVDLEEFEIIGGRIWAFDESNDTYTLKYQYGNVKKIPDEYSVPVAEQPTFAELTKKRVMLKKETDHVLLEKGIQLYSIAGVGDIVKTGKGSFYKYALGFNAEAILQSFFETLSIISSVSTVALRNLSNIELQRKISRDLEKASEIQRNLLPEHYLEFNDYKMFGVCHPDSSVGGDYFDYIKSSTGDDERMGVLISDACSKGLPAAVQALFVSGAFRMGMGFATRISPLLSRLNSLIYDTFLYERFVTLFYCELTMSQNRLVLYANAGHCPPFHYRAELDRFQQLNATGGLLGVVPHQKYSVENIRMKPGDFLVLYTDGITECQDKNGNLFGEERLCEHIRKHKNDSPRVVALSILEDVQQFTAGSTYSDDKTLVVIKRDPQ